METAIMDALELQTLRVSTDSDGVMTVCFDMPGKSVNTVTKQVLADLGEAISLIETKKPRGVIFASAKADCFIAGADLFEIRGLSPEDVSEFLATGQRLYDRIAALPMPTSAAINGDCLGGGLELALACTWRVAADDGGVSVGLPETKIGILPAWGGTVRLPRLIGITKALPLILAGKTMPPRKARKSGIIDETVRPEALLAAAKRLVLSKKQPQRRRSMVDRAARIGWLRKRILAAAEKRTLATTHGNYPAAQKVIDVVRTSFDQGHAAGLTAERKALGELMNTDACQNLMRLFFLRQRVKRSLGEQLKAKPREVKCAAVIGGGTMGAGIAHGLVRAGVQVRLVEVSAKACAAALGRIRRYLDDDVASGRLSALEARHAFNRICPTVEWDGLRTCDFAVEAIAETMAAKLEVFAKLDQICGPDTVLASNTSSLSITEMAAAASRPQRVVGLHFFNPVPKMPLVEVVRTAMSDDVSLATAAAISGRMGKTAVLVKDAPGFLVNRVLIPYLAEALVLAEEGASFTHVDEVMKAWGMPMGPFELLDEIGLDIGSHVLKSLGDRMDPPLRLCPAMGLALEKGWLGKKSGRGFYIHNKKSKSAHPKPNHDLAALLTAGRAPAMHSKTDIESRLNLLMVNEAARMLAEGVTDSAESVDLATVLGLGFAPFRGGLARFADTIGMQQIAAQLDELAARHGPRFASAAPLAWLAKNGSPLAEAVHFQKAGMSPLPEKGGQPTLLPPVVSAAHA